MNGIKKMNPKISNLFPQTWASFPGFSILFHLKHDDRRVHGFFEKLEHLSCNIDRKKFGLALQRRENYHVTAWDGINPANIDALNAVSKTSAKYILGGQPRTLHDRNAFFDAARGSSLFQYNWELDFDFSKLVVSRGSALVAHLQIKQPDREEFTSFCRSRQSLNKTYRDKFGHLNYDDYQPHVTLGYFIDDQHAELAERYVEDWSNELRNQIDGGFIRVSGVGLYAFMDMGTFISVDSLELPEQEGQLSQC